MSTIVSIDRPDHISVVRPIGTYYVHVNIMGAYISLIASIRRTHVHYKIIYKLHPPTFIITVTEM